MAIIKMAVRNKNPLLTGERYIVCHNANYVLELDLDEEWDAYKTVTVLFCMPGNAGTIQTVCEGRRCEVPVCTSPGFLQIGVTAGEVLRTSRPAEIDVRQSIRNTAGEIINPVPPDVLQVLLERIDRMEPGGGGKTVADVAWRELADSGGHEEFLLRVTYTDGTTNDIQIPTLDSQLKQIISIGSTPPRMAQVRELWFNTEEKMLYICTGKQQPYDEPIFEPVVPESGEDTGDDALSPGNTVLVTPQDLTVQQQTQARDNIGAVGTDELTGAVEDALTAAAESGQFKGDPGYTPQKGVDYFDGTSVTVQSVSESDASGGVNVVVFSDGERINVRNGRDGQNGKDGRDGQDGKDYVLTAEDKSEIAEQAAGLVDAALLAIIGEVSV